MGQLNNEANILFMFLIQLAPGLPTRERYHVRRVDVRAARLCATTRV